MSAADGARRDLTTLPKAHLHLHFTGSMRRQTLLELAAERGIRLPRSLTDDVALQVEPTRRGWFRFQRQYDTARAVVDSEQAMRRLLHEAAEDDAAEGSGRLELQVDPTSYAPFVGGLTPAIEIVLDPAAAGCAHARPLGGPARGARDRVRALERRETGHHGGFRARVPDRPRGRAAGRAARR